MTHQSEHSFAVIFPGQGSQSVGMLAELAQAEAVVAQTFAEASSVLDYDLWKLVASGPEATLNETDKTQPAMLAAGVAVWRVWQGRTQLRPAIMAGHSLGEYSALVCAGALTFQDALQMVAERGRLMQAAVPQGEGAMAAILGLANDDVEKVCLQARGDQVVAAVNYNSPGQVVIAGHAAAVERAIEAASRAGARKAVRLPVSVPSHCSLMEPAARKLSQRLATTNIVSPEIPVINNVDVACESDPDRIRDALVRQLSRPVQWVETVCSIGARGVDRILEFGPGKVLTGLTKRIDRNVTAIAVFDPATIGTALEQVA